MAVDQFCLKWNNFQASIISAFESLQSTQDLADVTLTTEGISVKAHKIILSACSPYFRTVFKENPCSHPIVILKDVLYDDLLAVLNFMYHGEVLVTKERLHSFLQTAEVLQVSGLIGCSDLKNQKAKQLKMKDDANLPTKRIKITPKTKKDAQILPRHDVERKDEKKDDSMERVKVEVDEHEWQADVNENVGNFFPGSEKHSILESVLESKDCSSILERSLLSHTTGSTSKQNDQQSTSELAKHLSVPKKHLETTDNDKSRHLNIDYSSNSSTVDLATETVKIEQESIEVSIDPALASETVRTSPHDVQPHHSSQCGNCPHCGKTYSNQSALKYHVRLVHSDLLNLYCCHLCPEIFDYREGFKKHMVEMHNLRN